jgi:hypothetical protein
MGSSAEWGVNARRPCCILVKSIEMEDNGLSTEPEIRAPDIRARRRILRSDYWPCCGFLSPEPSEKPILFCDALRIASKYFCSSPIVIEGLHWGVQL